MFFSSTPLLQLILPYGIFSGIGLLICTIAFFIASLPYINKPVAFSLRVMISVFLSLILARIIVKEYHGYGFLLALVNILMIVSPAILGYALAWFYKKTFESIPFLTYPINLQPIVIITIGGSLFLFIAIDIVDTRKMESELRKRYKLAENITLYYGKFNNAIKIRRGTIQLTTKVVIEKGLANNIYTPKDGSLTHGYDGNIIVSNDEKGISLVYKHIPSEDVCHSFYYVNVPLAFNDVYIDDLSTKTAGNSTAIDARDEVLCFSGKDYVTVRYFATYESLEM